MPTVKIPIYTCSCNSLEPSIKVRGRKICPVCKVGRVVGYMLTCPGYEGYECGVKIRLNANQAAKVRCPECARVVDRQNDLKRSKGRHKAGKPKDNHDTRRQSKRRRPKDIPAWWHSRPCKICGKPTKYPDWSFCPAHKMYVNSLPSD